MLDYTTWSETLTALGTVSPPPLLQPTEAAPVPPRHVRSPPGLSRIGRASHAVLPLEAPAVPQDEPAGVAPSP